MTAAPRGVVAVRARDSPMTMNEKAGFPPPVRGQTANQASRARWNMWRSLFLAVGIVLVLIGLECLVLDRALIAGRGTEAKEVIPPEWAAWTFLSAGVITVLWTFTIPKRVNG